MGKSSDRGKRPAGKRLGNVAAKSAAAFLRGLIWLLGQQPLKVHYFWASILSWFLRKIVHYRESVVYTNLAWAFPYMSYKEIRTVARDFYDHLAEIMVETIWFGGSSLERIHRQHIAAVSNPELISDLSQGGRPVLVLTAHTGNWELLGGTSAYCYNFDLPAVELDRLFIVYKELESKVSDLVFYDNRRQPIPGFQGMIESKGFLRFLLSRRNEPNLYFIINDQYPSQAGIDVGNFLNQRTTAIGASAVMANRLGMSVLFLRMDRLERGRYDLRFELITEDASAMDPKDITLYYMSLLEKEIQEYPANWLWSHMRWKNKNVRNKDLNKR